MKSLSFFYIFIHENAFENVVWKMAAILSRPLRVKPQKRLPIVLYCMKRPSNDEVIQQREAVWTRKEGGEK